MYRSVYCIIKDTNDIDPLNPNVRTEIVIYSPYMYTSPLELLY